LNILHYLHDTIDERGAAFCVLIDPDKAELSRLKRFVSQSADLGVDALLVGSSFLLHDSFDEIVEDIKRYSEIPVILFPGSAKQVSRHADAILFLSLISGRNPNFLFGDHVIAAPLIRDSNIEPIPTGYMLIESGSVSTTEYISNTRSIPRDKPDIALAHALAAEYLGMKLVYLEAGSGSVKTVPDAMISLIKESVTLPAVVGGGITKPEIAAEKVAAGADIIVVGNALENNWDEHIVSAFAEAVHNKK